MPKTVTTEARLVKIETTLDYVKKSIDENNTEHKLMMKKIDAFIDTADHKYATKSEVSEIKSQVQKNSSRLWDTSLKVAYALGVIAALYIGVRGGV